MVRARRGPESPRRLTYLVPFQELFVAVAAAVLMLAGVERVTNPLVLFEKTLFCLLLVLFCSAFVVRLDRGYLRLTMIATQVSAMVLPAPLAGLMGLVAGLLWIRHGSTPGLRYFGTSAGIFWTVSGAVVRIWVGSGSPVRETVGFVLAALSMTVVNWILTLLELSVLGGERATAIARRAFSKSFFAAFLYFALAAILMANLMDGSPRGYLLAAVVALLSVTLTETIAGRRSRSALEAHVADSQRYLGYSRALEGVVHSLRHQLAITKGYVEDVLESRLQSATRARVESAKASTNAALAMLDRLQASASPRVVFSDELVNLSDIAGAAVEFVRGIAAGQRTRLEISGQPRPIYLRGDPVLLRDVVAALLINALQAVGHGGVVSVSVAVRRGGLGGLSVSDSGPGLNEEQRDHLFEPHYTTKKHGTGMGLFTAFGVVREHRGHLVYEGDGKKGAVFTVLIPLAAPSAKGAEPVAEPADGLNPARISEGLSG